MTSIDIYLVMGYKERKDGKDNGNQDADGE